MPLIEFTCPVGHCSEFLLSQPEAARAKRRKCQVCGRPAKRAISAAKVLSSDFAIAKSYEKRKNQECPIR